MSVMSMFEDREAALAHLRMGRFVAEVARVLADSHNVSEALAGVYLRAWQNLPRSVIERDPQDSPRRLGTQMHEAIERFAQQARVHMTSDTGSACAWRRPRSYAAQTWLDEAINQREVHE